MKQQVVTFSAERNPPAPQQYTKTVHLSVGEVKKSLVCFFFHHLYEWNNTVAVRAEVCETL